MRLLVVPMHTLPEACDVQNLPLYVCIAAGLMLESWLHMLHMLLIDSNSWNQFEFRVCISDVDGFVSMRSV